VPCARHREGCPEWIPSVPEEMRLDHSAASRGFFSGLFAALSEARPNGADTAGLDEGSALASPAAHRPEMDAFVPEHHRLPRRSSLLLHACGRLLAIRPAANTAWTRLVLGRQSASRLRPGSEGRALVQPHAIRQPLNRYDDPMRSRVQSTGSAREGWLDCGWRTEHRAGALQTMKRRSLLTMRCGQTSCKSGHGFVLGLSIVRNCASCAS
jgi:hypothetical protein